MVMSMLDYLVDEYMESIVAKLGGDDLAFLELLIPDLCDTPKSQPNSSLNSPARTIALISTILTQKGNSGKS